jgi:hypothetical protein
MGTSEPSFRCSVQYLKFRIPQLQEELKFFNFQVAMLMKLLPSKFRYVAPSVPSVSLASNVVLASFVSPWIMHTPC